MVLLLSEEGSPRGRVPEGDVRLQQLAAMKAVVAEAMNRTDPMGFQPLGAPDDELERETCDSLAGLESTWPDSTAMLRPGLSNLLGGNQGLLGRFEVLHAVAEQPPLHDGVGKQQTACREKARVLRTPWPMWIGGLFRNFPGGLRAPLGSSLAEPYRG